MTEFQRGVLAGANCIKTTLGMIIEASNGRLERLNGLQVLTIMQESIDKTIVQTKAAIESGEYNA